MRFGSRKTVPKVRNGKTQRKNRTALSSHYIQTLQPVRPVIDRQRPGKGYRHLITKKQLQQFIDLLPDWEELSRGLDAVMLAPGHPDRLGWHRPRLVALCAWDQELEGEWDVDFIEQHRDVLNRLGVEQAPVYDGFSDLFGEPNPAYRLLKFTETSARGFQLMHVFLHELGHHHDRMTTKSKRRASRGESYAEEYAHKYAERIWDDYSKVFGW